MGAKSQHLEELDLPVHPPKVEVFDVAAGTNTDPKKHVRQVTEYRLAPFGLYLRRPMPGHPRFAGLESWLLPELGLRVTRQHWHPRKAEDLDYYLDIVDVETGPTRWRSTDWYLDIKVQHGRDAWVLDTDEFALAVQAGLLSAETAQRAMDITWRTVDGLARTGYDLPRMLASRGITLTWQDDAVGSARRARGRSQHPVDTESRPKR